MTFSQTKKPTNTVSTNKFNYPFKFYEKNYKKNSLDSKFKNKIQTTVSATEHTITTDKNNVIHRKLTSNPLHFQLTATAPTKLINTRQNTADQPTCSKTLDQPKYNVTPCIFSRKEAPKPTNQGRSEDWIKKKDQPRIKHFIGFINAVKFQSMNQSQFSLAVFKKLCNLSSIVSAANI